MALVSALAFFPAMLFYRRQSFVKSYNKPKIKNNLSDLFLELLLHFYSSWYILI
jgi:hypothetical protein